MYGAPRVRHALDHGSRRDGAARTGPARRRSATGPFRRLGTMIPKPARLPAPRNTPGATQLHSSKWGRDASQAKSTAALEARGSAISGSCRPITVGEPRRGPGSQIRFARDCPPPNGLRQSGLHFVGGCGSADPPVRPPSACLRSRCGREQFMRLSSAQCAACAPSGDAIAQNDAMALPRDAGGVNDFRSLTPSLGACAPFENQGVFGTSPKPSGVNAVSPQRLPSRAALARRWPRLRVNRFTGRWRDYVALLVMLRRSR